MQARFSRHHPEQNKDDQDSGRGPQTLLAIGADLDEPCCSPQQPRVASNRLRCVPIHLMCLHSPLPFDGRFTTSSHMPAARWSESQSCGQRRRSLSEGRAGCAGGHQEAPSQRPAVVAELARRESETPSPGLFHPRRADHSHLGGGSHLGTDLGEDAQRSRGVADCGDRDWQRPAADCARRQST